MLAAAHGKKATARNSFTIYSTFIFLFYYVCKISLIPCYLHILLAAELLLLQSSSRNDVPRVTQRFGTKAAHIWRRASVLCL